MNTSEKGATGNAKHQSIHHRNRDRNRFRNLRSFSRTAASNRKNKGRLRALPLSGHWLRGVDLNHRPLGYEPKGSILSPVESVALPAFKPQDKHVATGFLHVCCT